MKNVLGLIFAFDTDNDLRELTDHRTVSAVQFGGRYRVIDFMLSNMVNSGIYRVGILMKDKYQSLIDHIGSAKDWDMSRKNAGVTLLPPYSYSRKASPLVTGEYRGKIDALAGAIDYLQKNRADYVVLADGDVIANVPLDDVVEQHRKSGNDVTMVVTKRGPNDNQFVTYCELSRRREVVDIRVGDTNDGKCRYESMGVYVMSRAYLIHLIADCVAHNCTHFEREMLTRALIDDKVGAYVFNEYTVKIFDAKDYYQASMDILDKDIRDELFLRSRPIFTRIYDEAPAYYGDKADVQDSLVADGCHIEGKVSNCILFRDVIIEKDAEIRNSIIMENGRILSGASLDYIIADRGVTVREGRTMMGHENYPVVIGKSAVI
ncbi:MAG: glucose-1-phosphate adenylyltransferase subunit GlgD [Clostridiaceae bacterium]|nr:glucose-1-phosphate adenylyltransferase subunit GlgD [Clostridiaceae bacterium]NBH79488.1 glucose-1-phosphate adenylyltransferase subunit GlgD [Clostridiaceae bacterium]NBI81136.1 glucose-1-phosphate adenylyltransferase subunit GlgD [Clostridiaceae bacterium]